MGEIKVSPFANGSSSPNRNRITLSHSKNLSPA